MRFLHTFDLVSTLDSSISLLVAFVLGTLIGAERQYRQRSAGLRTNTLVAVGAAAFVDLAQRVGGDVESVRVISYVVSGIGFLGAGVIMKEGFNVRGLNTAATLWCSAAIGACAGADMVAEAILVTLFTLAGNTLLRPLADRIDRAPVDQSTTEARFEIRAMTDPEHLAAVRRGVIQQLNLAQYPVGDIEIAERGDDVMEVTAVLVSTAVVPQEIDRVVAEIGRLRGVADASWERSTLE